MKLTIRHFLNFSFIFELSCFAFTMLLAMGVALNLAEKVPIASLPVTSERGMAAWQFVVMFAVATVILLIILRYFNRPWIIQGLFYLAIIEGLLYFSQAFFSWPDFAYVIIFLLVAWGFYRNIFMHDIIIILAISAIAVIFGSNFWPSAVILILLFLAIYDAWAVYKTKHMVKMFRGLAESKVHFSLIIPHDFKGLFKKTKEANPGSEFMFLGTGDLTLPAIFVVSCLKISHQTAVITSLGAIGGFILLYILFASQEKREPMPGLPPIVLGCLIGFLIAFLV
jgi:presenilin-like A22 family membrane protease